MYRIVCYNYYNHDIVYGWSCHSIIRPTWNDNPVREHRSFLPLAASVQTMRNWLQLMYFTPPPFQGIFSTVTTCFFLQVYTVCRLNILENSIRRAGSPDGNLIPTQQANELLLSVEELREYARDKKRQASALGDQRLLKLILSSRMWMLYHRSDTCIYS